MLNKNYKKKKKQFPVCFLHLLRGCGRQVRPHFCLSPGPDQIIKTPLCSTARLFSLFRFQVTVSPSRLSLLKRSFIILFILTYISRQVFSKNIFTNISQTPWNTVRLQISKYEDRSLKQSWKDSHLRLLESIIS